MSDACETSRHQALLIALGRKHAPVDARMQHRRKLRRLI
jgi:hypothetical protein